MKLSAKANRHFNRHFIPNAFFIFYLIDAKQTKKVMISTCTVFGKTECPASIEEPGYKETVVRNQAYKETKIKCQFNWIGIFVNNFTMLLVQKLALHSV